MCPFKQLQIKKQSNIYCIYMTSLRCEFTLSLSDVSSLLKKSVDGCFCCMDSDCSGPLCELVEAFGRGADNCSITARLLRPAHLFRPFLRRVRGDGAPLLHPDHSAGQVQPPVSSPLPLPEHATPPRDSTTIGRKAMPCLLQSSVEPLTFLW